MECTLEGSKHERVDGNDGPLGGTLDPTATEITARRLLAMLESQQHKCALTGRELEPETASLDHMIPLSRGGPNTIANVQIVHTQVNAAKATMTNDEFIALCKDVAAYCSR